MTVRRVAKALVAASGILVALATGLADDGALSPADIAAIAGATLIALGVYRVPNTAS